MKKFGKFLSSMPFAITLLVLLANVSVRMLDSQVGAFLTVLMVLVLILTFVAVVVAELMPLILMIQRFYKNQVM